MIKSLLCILTLLIPSEYEILKTYNHNQNYYTQGFVIHDGILYEGTGQYGKSKIIKYDLKTMKELSVLSISPSLFGEGIAILDNKLFQLTWKSKKVLVYDLKTMEKINEFHNYLDGWGLTQGEESLFMSDGSNKIFEIDPNTFKEINNIEVFDENGPLNQINELEYVEGYIFANIYHTNTIVKIDPRTGYVEKKYDMTGILKDKISKPIDVLNGIAYNSTDKTFYITGKLWPKMFQVVFN